MKGYLLAVIGFVLAGFLAWLHFVHKSKPTTISPTFIQGRLVSERFVPVTDKIVKVYAVCPESILTGSYVMGWTATANYTLDLSKMEFAPGTPPEISATDKLVINLPALGLLNNGDNIIGSEDHYWYPRPFALGLRKDYAKEKLRANQIAIASALSLIAKQDRLSRLAEEQVKATVVRILAGEGSKPPDVEVHIAKYAATIPKVESPRFCKQQPLAGDEVPPELADPAVRDTAPVSPTLNSFATVKLDGGTVSGTAWEAWVKADSPPVPPLNVRPQ